MPSVEESEESDQEPEKVVFDADMLRSQALSKRFFSLENKKRWDKINNKDFVVESRADLSKYRASGFTAYVEALGLQTAVSVLEDYNPTLVREFYCNLTGETADSSSQWHHRVYLRGSFVQFSPEKINKVLGIQLRGFGLSSEYPEDYPSDMSEVASNISGGVVPTWPDHPSKFLVSKLTVRHSLLFKFVVNNWLVSSNKTVVTIEQGELLYNIGCKREIDFGKLLFQAIFSDCFDTRMSKITHPCLITALIRDSGISVTQPGLLLKTVRSKPTSATVNKAINDLPWDFDGSSTVGTSQDAAVAARVQVLRNEIAEARRKKEFYADVEAAVEEELRAFLEKYNQAVESDEAIGSASSEDSDSS